MIETILIIVGFFVGLGIGLIVSCWEFLPDKDPWGG